VEGGGGGEAQCGIQGQAEDDVGGEGAEEGQA